MIRMSDPGSNAEQSLRKLGERLRRGWEHTRPVTSQEMEKVRRAVRQQWEKEQEQVRARTPDSGPPTPLSQNTEKDKQTAQEEEQSRQAKQRSRDNEHDQSH